MRGGGDGGVEGMEVMEGWRSSQSRTTFGAGLSRSCIRPVSGCGRRELPDRWKTQPNHTQENFSYRIFVAGRADPQRKRILKMEELWKDGRRPEGSCAVSASVGLTSCLPPSLNHPSDAGGSD